MLVAIYLGMAMLLATAFSLMGYKNGVDTDDGSRLTASALLGGVRLYGGIWAVGALPALILGVLWGWAAKGDSGRGHGREWSE